MITGNVLSKDQFDSLVSCLRCGLRQDKTNCDTCKYFTECQVCGIVLRDVYHRSYVYKPKLNGKEYIEEYTIIGPVDILDHHTCKGCENWLNRIKNKCYKCNVKFENTPRHFKANGNFCELCSLK